MFGHHRRMIKLFVCLFVCSSVVSQNSLKIVHSYGIEEVSTIEYVNKIQELDTNSVIIFMKENYFSTKLILDEVIDIYGENYNCEKKFRSVRDKERTFGGNIELNRFDLFFKQKDSLKYFEFKESLKLNEGLVFNSNEIKSYSKNQRTVISKELVNIYKLTGLDSLFVVNSLINLEDVSQLKLLKEIDRLDLKCKVICIFSSLLIKNEFSNFLSLIEEVNYPVSIVIARKGDSKKFTYFKFRNKIKGYRKLIDLQEIDVNQLPRRVKLDINTSIGREKIRGFHVIYVSKLDNCMW